MPMKTLDDRTLNDVFRCHKREGPEAGTCKNCGNDHTITQELLRNWIIAMTKQYKSGLGEDIEIFIHPDTKK